MNVRFRWIMGIAATLTVAAIGIAIAIFQSKPAFIPPTHSSIPVLEVPQFAQSVREIDTGVFIEDERASSVWASVSSSALKKVEGRIVAGVVNHHALAADLIATFFANLRASRPDIRRIVLISPDHYKVGRDEVSTHIRPYRAGAGYVRVDEDAVRRLVSQGVAREEDGDLFEREHGIGAIAPFISRAYPDIKLVPIAFRGDLTKERSRRLSDALKELWDEKTVIIISADMSHYLSTDQALKNDKTTLRMLETRDEAIASLNDDYIDSGKSVAALFSVLNEEYPNASFVRFAHAISSDYGADPSNTTSYITGVWEERRSER